MRALIEQTLVDLYGAALVTTNFRILYGGSVKPDNAKGLLYHEEIDGALVGGASLIPEYFAEIVKY